MDNYKNTTTATPEQSTSSTSEECNSNIDRNMNTSTSLIDNNFLMLLKREPNRRSLIDNQTLYYYLRSLDCLSRLEDCSILTITQVGIYTKKCANDILYCRGELASCWYILLSGSVFIDGSMFLPIVSFGHRAYGQSRRPNECLILETSEMISIDYIDSYYQPPTGLNHINIKRNSNRNSASSETSSNTSAYSGSDTMGSSIGGGQGSDDMDLSGLLESAVDSDEDDDLADSMDSLTVRDAVRECLEKDPIERTEHDISVLLEFTQHLSAFNNLTNTVRRALCQAMVFAVVEKSNTIVLNDGEELDSWSVLVHGLVEVTSNDGQKFLLNAGDSFGLPPTLDKQYFNGEMRTRTDDCQFVCVTQNDYYRILKQGQDNQLQHYDSENKLILITEYKNYDNRTSGQLIIRGSLETLTQQLIWMENPSIDPTFVEDFLLTHRVFTNSLELSKKLINWFNDSSVRDRVTRTVLLWVNNHFIDFETDKELMSFLLRFQSLLEQSGKDMAGQLRLLQIACSAKSRSRSMTLTRPSREDELPFNIMGGADSGYGIYISHVTDSTRASELGLRPGDELLEVNNTSFRSITLTRAFDVLKSSTHLVLTVKCNFLGYHECLHSSLPLLPRPNPNTNTSTTHHVTTLLQKHNKTSSRKERLVKSLMKLHLLPKSQLGHLKTGTSESTTDANALNTTDDIDNFFECGSIGSGTGKIDFPENVLKIYRPDQTFKYFLVNRETTTREVVMLALQEFLDLQNHNSRDYALFQVSLPNSILKQTRLPDHLDSLAERLPLGSRYYIKRSDSTDPLLPLSEMPEIIRETEVHLLNLNPIELALQLTLEDYQIFRQIESTEYIDDLFNLNSNYGTPNLTKFSKLVNRETFWVVSEITKEINLNKRVNIIKRFIKISKQCKECRNFNSMFAIISGLGHSSISRLKLTWDKLPGKYTKLFMEMQELMDPSRNMGKYRSLLSQSSGQTPMIPFYPVVRKDLTFIDLGNTTNMNGLLNFEKMRMIAKEIRSLVQMSAAPFDTSSQPTMAAMNQLISNSNGSSQLTTTTGKRNKSNKNKNNGGQPNPKKMWEEMNMIRKVKAYLRTLIVIHDESQLHQMSLQIEPNPITNPDLKLMKPPPISQQQNTSSSTTLSRRHGGPPGQSSPTLSTSSSTSTDSINKRKFALAPSPGSYQKLMSLSEMSTCNSNRIKSSSTIAAAGNNSSTSGTASSVQVGSQCPSTNSISRKTSTSSNLDYNTYNQSNLQADKTQNELIQINKLRLNLESSSVQAAGTSTYSSNTKPNLLQ